MPTPTGLPKVGEVWEHTFKQTGSPDVKRRFVVMERGRGDYYRLRVYVEGEGLRTFLEAAYWMSRGELKFIGVAGPKIKAKLGLPF